MTMSRTDYVAIADIVNSAIANSDNASETALNIGVGMSRYFAQNNPRFDRAKFLDACGIQVNDTPGEPAYSLKADAEDYEPSYVR